jgi:hypothetical protein
LATTLISGNPANTPTHNTSTSFNNPERIRQSPSDLQPNPSLASNPRKRSVSRDDKFNLLALNTVHNVTNNTMNPVTRNCPPALFLDSNPPFD